MRTLLADLMAYPNTPRDLRLASANENLPTIPLGFKIEEGVLDLFSMITTVGAPQMVSAEEIRLESMFPWDEKAERLYLRFLNEKL